MKIGEGAPGWLDGQGPEPGSTRSSATSRIRARSGIEVARTAREVASDLRRDERLAARVVVKVRFAPFFTSTHGVTLAEPTADPEAVAEAAARALERFDLDRPVRLVGSERR